MSDLKIVIPMAGWGTRMRPHTWSKPKSLVAVAGKTTLDYLLEMFQSLPQGWEVEYVFIVSPGLGETHIPRYMAERHPSLRVHYVVQAEMKGQSHALYLAREHLHGPMIMCFSDTLLETDFSFLQHETADGVAWVKEVEDPRRFGVAEVDPSGQIRRLIEKPQSMENRLAVVGCYYFRRGEALVQAIEEQMQRNIQLKGEFFLADAINILLERGAALRPHLVDIWLDTGTIPATLETNRYLLSHRTFSLPPLSEDVRIIPPVAIHPEARISHSTIGPNVSIGAGCVIEHARIEDSILENGVTVQGLSLIRSFVGQRAKIVGTDAQKQVELNIGDDSSILVR
ncbi:MAG: sugar phosphate nucleotidyltransferase [Anaerolineales bacterium]